MYTIASEDTKTERHYVVGVCSDYEIAVGMAQGFQEILDDVGTNRRAIVLGADGNQVWPE